MKTWICSKCGHMVLAKDKPSPIRWTDGHVCHFVEEKEKVEFRPAINEDEFNEEINR